MSKTYMERDIFSTFRKTCDKLIGDPDSKNLREFIDYHLNEEYVFKEEDGLLKPYFYYLIGAGFFCLHTRENTSWFDNEDLDSCVIFFRKALHCIKKIKRRNKAILALQSSIESGLANALYKQNRFFCCNDLLEDALKHSVGNYDAVIQVLTIQAQVELSICWNLYDESHRDLHAVVLYQIILSIIEIYNASEGKIGQKEQLLNSELLRFKERYESADVEAYFTYFKEAMGYQMQFESKEHKKYLEWCGINRLFLNDLNDIRACELVYQDVIELASFKANYNSMLTPTESLMYHGNYEELKSDYCYARYLMFSSKDMSDYQIDIFNRDYKRVSDLAGSVYNLKSQNYKSAYKIVYSLFDKIAYFIHRFFGLNKIDSDYKVTFDSLFRDLKTRKKWKPNQELKDSNNIFLHALFYVLKDVRDVREHTPVSKWIDPEALAFSKIRNTIEHRSLRIVHDDYYDIDLVDDDESFNQKLKEVLLAIDSIKTGIETNKNEILLAKESDDKKLVEDLISKNQKLKKSLKEKQLLYEKYKLSSHTVFINMSQFESRLMTLIKLARSSIIYLSLAIHFDTKEKAKDCNEVIFEMELPYIQQDNY